MRICAILVLLVLVGCSTPLPPPQPAPANGKDIPLKYSSVPVNAIK